MTSTAFDPGQITKVRTPWRVILGSSLTRRLLGAVTLLILGYELIVPSLLVTTHDGFVSADLVYIRTPASGHISALYSRLGQPVDIGTPLASIASENAGHDITDARREVERLAQEVEAYRQAQDTLNQFSTSLQARAEHYKSLVKRFDIDLYQQGRAFQSGFQKQSSKLQQNVQRQDILAGEGLTSKISRNSSAAEQALAAGNASAGQFDAESRAVRVAGAEEGLLVDTGTNGASYFVQKADEIRLRAMDMKLSTSIAAAQFNAASDKLRQLLTQTQQTITSPVPGIIWRQVIAKDQSIRQDEAVLEIADANTTFAIALIEENRIQKLKIGAPADIHISGYPGHVHGIIRGWVLDPKNNTGLAVTPQTTADENAYVCIEITDLDRSRLGAALIGRRAKVVLPRHHWEWLSNLFSRF